MSKCSKTTYEEIELPNIYMAKIIEKRRVGRFSSKSWFIKYDHLDIFWMTCKPAPDEVSIAL